MKLALRSWTSTTFHCSWVASSTSASLCCLSSCGCFGTRTDWTRCFTDDNILAEWYVKMFPKVMNSLHSNLPGHQTFHNGRIISNISPLISSAGSSPAAPHPHHIRSLNKQGDPSFIWLALLSATVSWFPHSIRSASARHRLRGAGS